MLALLTSFHEDNLSSNFGKDPIDGGKNTLLARAMRLECEFKRTGIEAYS